MPRVREGTWDAMVMSSRINRIGIHGVLVSNRGAVSYRNLGGDSSDALEYDLSQAGGTPQVKVSG